MAHTLTGDHVTHVVPLGMSCRVTYQMRTYFRSGTAYPFDWWISSMDGITRYLKDPDPDRIFSEDCLNEQVDGGWIHSIVNRTFGFQLFHEFPRQTEMPAMRVVSLNWRDHIAAARSKHFLRLQRLLDLDRPENRILFVRHKLDAFGDKEQLQTRVEDLWYTLKARWQHADIRLLLVNVPWFKPPCQQVLRLEFSDPPGPPPESWRGDEKRWAAALESLGLAPQFGTDALQFQPSPGEA